MTLWEIALKTSHRGADPKDSYKKFILCGRIEAEIQYPTDPTQNPLAYIIFENGTKIPMNVKEWRIERI
jgi:hypothetical protein